MLCPLSLLSLATVFQDLLELRPRNLKDNLVPLSFIKTDSQVEKESTQLFRLEKPFPMQTFIKYPERKL